MRAMLSGRTDAIVMAEALMIAWGRVEEAELRRLAPGCTLSGMLGGGDVGFDCNAVSVEDVEMIGVAMKDLAAVFPDEYTVLCLVYKRRFKLDDVVKAVGRSKSSVKTLKQNGLVFVVSWMRQRKKSVDGG